MIESRRAPELQIFGGLSFELTLTNAERMWEEFSQSSTPSQEDKRKLGTTYLGRRKQLFILFQVSGHLKFSVKGSKREVFGMTIPNELINNVIRGADYYDDYLERFTKHQRDIAGKVVKKRTAQSLRGWYDEFVDVGVTAAKPSLEVTEEGVTCKVLQESLTDAYPTQGVSYSMWLSGNLTLGNFNHIPRGARKGERESRRGTSCPSSPQPSNSKEEELDRTIYISEALSTSNCNSRSDTESDEEMPSVGRSGNQDEGQAGLDHGTLDEGQAGSDPGSDPGTRDEGQAGSNPGTLDEGQAGSDPGTRDEGQAGPNPDDINIAESLPLPTPSVLAGPNLEHSDVEITDPSSQPQPEHMDEGHFNHPYVDIYRVIDLASRPDSPNVHWPLPTTTTTTAAPTTLPLPPQLQHGSSESLLIKRMGELEQHIADRVDENQALESR
ncbi:hypothetical protein Tco_1097377, partial [Tanacetum coccineum]